MVKHKILIIDDDIDICKLLQRFFNRKGFEVNTAFNASDGLLLLKENEFDVLLTDFRLPDKDGFEMIKSVKALKQNLPVIVVTGYSDVNQAVKLIKKGVFEYITKPIYPEEILKVVNKAIQFSSEIESKKKMPSLNSKSEQENTSARNYLITGKSYSKEIEKMISIVAPTEMTAVIIGESGTGKEVVARRIHEVSPRKNAPFVPVDCGALSPELASSELFGHLKGSFTGATWERKGAFEQANRGTLFLDEIANLSYENQVKLLRVLQEKVIRKVGAEKDLPIDVRIIVATNEDLREAVEKGVFREDIYYRINEFKIILKPLRENVEELEEFAFFFIHEANKKLSKSVKYLSEEVKQIFQIYGWPGNIRELKNVIGYSVLVTENEVIDVGDLPKEIIQVIEKMDETERNCQLKRNSLFLKDVTETAETMAIKKAMDLAKQNKSKAAEILGIDRKTLYNKLYGYGMITKNIDD